ncbi:MAG: nucleotidyltransferase domain-containing protein [Patescibacteria group bacterium]
MNQLDQTIEKLKSNDEVDSVFLTGSHSNQEAKAYSDIDLVIILKENKNKLYSLYRWIDGVFADIFFFDLVDLKRISESKKIDSDNFDAILLDWIKKSNIYFDKSGILTELKSKASEINTSQPSDKSKKGFWQRINQNYVVDKRYFDSEDPLYHEALEIKLLYSMEQVICAYFAFRDIPWRGEKNAILYLKDNAPDFYKLFQNYTSATSLTERFEAYSQMFDSIWTNDYKKWTANNETILKKDFSVADPNDSVSDYIKSLF